MMGYQFPSHNLLILGGQDAGYFNTIKEIYNEVLHAETIYCY
jgi:hypothetical protein